MSTQLVIASPIVNSVVPKPTKAEIIEALAAKKHAQLTKEYDELEAKYTALEADAKAALLDWISKNIHTLNFSVNIGNLERREWRDPKSPLVLRSVSCSASLIDVPTEIASKCKTALRAQECIKRVPDILSVRRDIRDKISGHLTNRTDRVNAILADEKSSKALDAMLRSMDKAPDAEAVSV